MSENYLGIMTRIMTRIMSENYHRKLSPSILSRQKVMTYRNTSYLKRDIECQHTKNESRFLSFAK